jgi:hypothetical protein
MLYVGALLAGVAIGMAVWAVGSQIIKNSGGQTGGSNTQEGPDKGNGRDAG